MDNKITKKRLSNFLSYEWILILIAIVGAILLWEFVYTVSSVRLTVGQSYKIFYDKYSFYGENVSALAVELEVQENLGYENGKTFSFDVQKTASESILQEDDVLSIRLSVQEGDILITDDKARTTKKGEVEYTESLARTRVDNLTVNFATFDKLLKDAQDYLKSFLADGQTEIAKENLDDNKIKAGFEKRLRKDNRFRRNKEEGLRLEKQRLEKLCDEVNAFETVVNLDDEYFFTYTKYEQSLEIAKAQGQDASDYEQLVQKQERGKYGLRLDKLTGGKYNSSKFFTVLDEDEYVASDAVIMVFDFLKYQPELQFESITFINNIVRACSTILD